MFRISKLFVVVLFALSGAFANAGLINVIGGTPHTTPANNDVAGQVNGRLGSNLFLTAGSTLTYTYKGKEAGWLNVFLAQGDGASFGWFDTATSTIGDSFDLVQSSAGQIDFGFFVLNTWKYVLNGENGSPPSVPNFFTEIIDGDTVRVMLDDGGAGPDRDLDDLVVQIEATALSVPEPGSLSLLGAGLVAFGLIRRKRA